MFILSISPALYSTQSFCHEQLHLFILNVSMLPILSAKTLPRIQLFHIVHTRHQSKSFRKFDPTRTCSTSLAGPLAKMGGEGVKIWELPRKWSLPPTRWKVWETRLHLSTQAHTHIYVHCSASFSISDMNTTTNTLRRIRQLWIIENVETTVEVRPNVEATIQCPSIDASSADGIHGFPHQWLFVGERRSSPTTSRWIFALPKHFAEESMKKHESAYHSNSCWIVATPNSLPGQF